MARREQELKAVERAKRRKAIRDRKRKRAWLISIELCILVMLLGTGAVMAKYGKFDNVLLEEEEQKEESDGIKKSKNYQTLLIFGSDSKEGQKETGAHSDTVILLSIDKETKEIKAEQIYEDLLVATDSRVDLVKNVFCDEGAEKAMQVLGKNLDISIDHYLTFDYKALASFVDQMGGVSVDLSWEEAAMMNEYIVETATACETTPVLIEGNGEHLLDGAQTVTYLRMAKLEGGDRARLNRQKAVIQTVFTLAENLDAASIELIANMIIPEISTSMKPADALDMAKDYQSYSLSTFSSFPKTSKEKDVKEVGKAVVTTEREKEVTTLHTFLFPRDKYEMTDQLKEYAKQLNAIK